MKQLFFLLLALTLFVDAEQMSSMEHQSIHSYSHRPNLKKSGEKKAHRLHKIDEDQARVITQKYCKEKGAKLKLTHSGRTLYYIAETKNCAITINALDGTVRSVDTEIVSRRKER